MYDLPTTGASTLTLGRRLTTKTLYLKTLQQKYVSNELAAFVRKLGANRSKEWTLKAFECGSGGDCLFHSIFAGVNVLREEYRDKYAEAFAKNGGLLTSAKGIRCLAAKTLVAEDHAEFLNKIIVRKNDELSVQWNDAWSPRDALVSSNLEILTDPSITRVNGVQYDNDMISVVKESIYGGSRSEDTHVIENLSTSVADLRVNVERELSREGHHHWGDFGDIDNLSRALSVGFIVFRNETHDGIDNPRGWISSLAASESNYSHWMLLYCIGVTHFQLVALTHDTRDDQVVFAIHEVPEAIRQVYDLNNPTAKMGQSISSRA